MGQQVQVWAVSGRGSIMEEATEAKNKQNSRRWWLCPIRGYTQVPSYAHLLSLAFEALGWCLQPTLPIDGERSREIWRILGTGDAHLTGQRC